MCVNRSACAGVLAIALLISFAPARAATLSLAWDPNAESDIGGYLVRYGTQSGSYTTVVDVGNQASASIQNLVEGQRYYFVVQAYDTSRLVSTLSPEVSGVAPATSVTGLVAAFGFEEASGSVTNDTSPNHLTGTLTGASRATSGRFGRALSFDGNGNWVTVLDSPVLDLTTGMTIEAWVNPTDLCGWRSIAMKESDTALAYALYASDNEPLPSASVRIGDNTVSDGTSGSTPLQLNVWTHVAASYDGASLRLYVNGVLVNMQAVSGSIVTTSGPLRIGGDAVWGEFFKGLIDEVRIYNRALSQPEISVDMSQPVAPGLVAAYGFEETSSTATADASGNGNTGTISGASRSSRGRFGRALSFDGVSSLVTVADAAILDVTRFTVEAWVYPTSLQGWRTVVMKEAPSGMVFGLYANDSGPAPGVTATVSGVEYSAPGAVQLATRKWTHLAATYDGETLRLFVDGTEVRATAASGTLATSANPLRIGGNTVWGESFSGKIDEVRIYDHALTQAEIRADMNRPVP